MCSLVAFEVVGYIFSVFFYFHAADEKMCVLPHHQDHHDRLHRQTDEQGSVSQLVGGRHRQDSKLQLGPIQGDTLSPCQVEAVFLFFSPS